MISPYLHSWPYLIAGLHFMENNEMNEYAELIEEKRQLEYRRNLLVDKIKLGNNDLLIYNQCNIMTQYMLILNKRIDNAYDECHS